MSLPKAYEPKKYEADIYRLWEESGSFVPSDAKDTYCILMPPPNANGSLHLGHALTFGLEDIMVRVARMQGKATLYLPGSDHAGFETQVVYEKQLEKEGKSRFDFSRDELYSQIWDFVWANKGNVEDQLRQLGVSADWGHNTFTLDERIIDRAYKTFQKMWDDNLIYRGERIVNYCTRHGTGFADIEVEYKDEPSKLTHIRYPVESGGGEITVATTRPETMLGDTAVAVHPKDPRYKKLVGKVIDLPLVGRPIPIVADEAVDKDFGSGAVKVTPAHDETDFEIGTRHELPRVQVIGFDGKMTEEAPARYRGLSVQEARQKVVADLKDKGFLIREEDYSHRVGTCYKCGTVIEPLPLEQWFVAMKPLAKRAIDALDSGKIEVIPDSKRKALKHYLGSIKDWNISRQIAWGIPIPAFQNVDNPDDWIFDTRVKDKTIEIGGKTYHRDQDVFDTWFSSGQWPFATLGYPDHEDFKRFYPTSVMETGGEILFQWVGRMIMLGLYITGEVPFKTVYIHGYVMDEAGKKMSKSLGNVIDPLEVIDEYGADSLRMGLVAGRTAGLNQGFGYSKVKGARNFTNKLWNVARFALDNATDAKDIDKVKPTGVADEWILTRLHDTIEEVDQSLDSFRFNEALGTIISFVWDDLADWYVETTKFEPNYGILLHALSSVLRLTHPFAPFATEAIWQAGRKQFGPEAPFDNEQLISASWPEAGGRHQKGAAKFRQLQDLIVEIRTIRAELDLADVVLYHSDDPTLETYGEFITKLSGISDVKAVDEGRGLPLLSTDIDCWLGVDHATIKNYLGRLQDNATATERAIKSLQERLDNKSYVDKAPKEIVAETKQQLADARAKLKTINDKLKQFKQFV